ncbi:HAD hydrolase-like protein [Chloroflexi bacterium TSY]|nr:HAD hydrolase-like protein [Chloroflexi bacterium TSY]
MRISFRLKNEYSGKAPTLANISLAKPSPALLQQAETLLGLAPNGAWMVGDRISDLQTAQAYGATPLLVRTGDGLRTEKELGERGIDGIKVYDDLAAAVEHILG